MYNVLDTVALTHDIPEAHLCRGDRGAVIEVYGPDAIEVEFIAATGRTQAVLTLCNADVRRLSDADLIAVRSGAQSDV